MINTATFTRSNGHAAEGLVTLGILSRIEALLAARVPSPRSFRLCDAFDFIGGAGSGGLIAIALARGKTIAEIADLYDRFAADMFGRHVKALSAFFKPDARIASARVGNALREMIG